MEITEVWSVSHQFSSTHITNQYDQLFIIFRANILQGGSNMTGTDLYVNKPHCAAAVRP